MPTRQHPKRGTGDVATKDQQATGLPNSGFAVPSIGVSPLTASVASMTNATPVGSQTAVMQSVSQPKTVQAVMHQRANKVGKIDARIKKLQAAIEEVKRTWPQHVHQVQQELQADYQRCIDFHKQASAELVALQAEYHELTKDQPRVQMPSVQSPYVQTIPAADFMNQPRVNIPHVQDPYVQTPNPASIDPNLVYVLQLALNSLGVGNGTAHLPQTHAMDVDATAPAMHMPVPMPTNPQPNFQQQEKTPATISAMPHNLGTGFEMPQVNAHPPTPNRLDQGMRCAGVPDQFEAPKGEWDWPPKMPRFDPSLLRTELAEEEMFPNPLYKDRTRDATPVLPVATPGSTDYLDPASKAVQEAAQQYCEMYNVINKQQLPDDIQARLQTFAQQQQECQAKMRDFLAQQATSAEQATQQQTAAAPTIHAPCTPQRIPTAHHEAVSINSSPVTNAPTVGSASPRGQRQPKIIKQVEGNIHEQPGLHSPNLGIAEPVPLTPMSSRSPTPVPTEIAESEWQPGEIAPLQSLE